MRKCRDRAKQWPPWATCGGTHGPRWRGARPGGASNFAVFRAVLRLPAVFATFCLYNAHVPRPNEHLIHSIFFFFSPLDFRIVLERERGSDEDLRGFYAGR